MANITLLRDSGGITITQVGRPTYTNADPRATVEIVGGTDIWVTMIADGAQFRFNLTDTITINGAVYSGTLAALQIKLRDTVLYQARTRSEIAMAISLMGGSLLGESVGMTIKHAIAAMAMTSQALRIEPVIANMTGQATGVRLNLATQGVYTANNFNGASLSTYNTATGAMTQVAISADLPNIWASAVGWIDFPFVTPYAMAADQIYVVQFIYSSSAQTTAPALRGANIGATISATYPMANSAKLTGTLSGQTGLLASTTMSAFSPSSTAFWCAIY